MGSGEPTVVQGTAVASPYDHSPGGGAALDVDGGGVTAGEKQETRCRDPVFAILLYGNVAAIVAVAGIYGTAAFSEALDESKSGYDYTGFIYATFILGVVALVLAGVSMPVLMCIPNLLIKASLIGMLILSGLMVAWSFYMGSIFGGIVGLIFFLIFACYTRCVWSRIPFASINLVTATTAIRQNCGIIFVSYFFVALAFGWSLLWSVATLGVWDEVVAASCEKQSATGGCLYETNSANYGYLFLLFLSYFFTHQVIQNTTHVTVAGTVGAWWFTPSDASSCCSSGITGSLCRSLTTSFGSICFGSLLVALIQALKSLAQSARNNDNQILICFAECILACIQSIIEYFNKWAFVYVGLYGYSYLESGRNVMTLFANRGWEAIIADDLISNVFFFVSLAVGGICAAVGLSFDETRPEGWFENAPPTGDVQTICAGLGFVVGLVLTSILMSSIASAVNTVIVCFAEGPAEFEANHPDLSRKMREIWLTFYPECGV